MIAHAMATGTLAARAHFNLRTARACFAHSTAGFPAPGCAIGIGGTRPVVGGERDRHAGSRATAGPTAPSPDNRRQACLPWRPIISPASIFDMRDFVDDANQPIGRWTARPARVDGSRCPSCLGDQRCIGRGSTSGRAQLVMPIDDEMRLRRSSSRARHVRAPPNQDEVAPVWPRRPSRPRDRCARGRPADPGAIELDRLGGGPQVAESVAMSARSSSSTNGTSRMDAPTSESHAGSSAQARLKRTI